jgi:hypothetical protein
MLSACRARDWWRHGEHDSKGTGTLHVVNAVNRAVCRCYKNFDLEASAGDGTACLDIRLPVKDV